MGITDTFNQEAQHAAGLDDEIEAAVWALVLATSLEAKANIQRAMPVDTGQARARWGSQNDGDGIWRENRDGLEVVQGAQREPFEYISRLNEGWSQQAPAGFIDAEAERATDDISDGILNAIVQEWSD